MKTYALWEIRTNNLVCDFDNEHDALALTLRFIERNGPAVADYLALTIEDEQGDGALIASGQELVDLARHKISEPHAIEAVMHLEVGWRTIGGMDTTTPRTPYPTDVSDDEGAFLAPYLTLMREDAPQRKHALRELFNGLRYITRTGLQWRFMPHDLPPWAAVYQQTQRWYDAGVFDTIIADLRELIRLGEGRAAQPTAAIFDSRTLQSTPESGARAGWDGAKRRKGTKVHLAVDTLGQFLALVVTPADAQDRAQVADVAEAVQAATGETVELAYVDQGYTGDQPAADAADAGIALEVVKLPGAKRGFVLLPRRWVVERDFGWLSRFRRLARDQERLAETLKGFHLVAFLMLMWKHALAVLSVL